MTGLRTRSANLVTNGAFTMSHTSRSWYFFTSGWVSFVGLIAQRSHQ